MAESKHLGAELGVGAGADQDELDHEEDELVGEAREACTWNAPRRHDDPRAPPAGPAPRFTPGRVRRCPIELALAGVRHTWQLLREDEPSVRVPDWPDAVWGG